MNNTTVSGDVLDFNAIIDKPKLPSFLNVLTILTFIGCAFDLFNAFKNFISGADNIEKIKKAQENMDQMPSWAKRFISDDVLAMAQKAVENKVPLLIIGLLAVILCIYGAIEMRKLKKQGYILWLAGEILPIIGSVLFMGTLVFKTTFVFFMIFPIIFIILYTSQKKYLVN